MKARSPFEVFLSILATLVLGVLYQLVLHFVGWLPASSTGSAILLGVLMWGGFVFFFMATNAVRVFVIGDLIVLALGGVFFWVALNIFAIQTLPMLALTALALPYSVLAYVARKILE